MKRVLCAAALMAGALLTHDAEAACGKVTISDMNWPSATLMANVDMLILNMGYGCEAELVPGDTMPTGTSMIEKGQPDVAPEFWSQQLQAKRWRRAFAKKGA